MYNPNYDKLPPQQGWQCPLCGMVWAPSIVSCTCNKNEVVKKNNTTNTISLGGPYNINTSLPMEINYPNFELIDDTAATIDTKITFEDKPDLRKCIHDIHMILASNPPQN